MTADRGRILHYDGTTWRLTDTGVMADLLAIGGRSRSELYAVGSGGAMVRFDGSRWARVAPNTDRSLNSVSGSTVGVYFAGESGAVMRIP